MKVTIKERTTGTILASTDDPSKVESFEGNWYFDPSVVNQVELQVTDDLYTCPYKGTCNWVSFSGQGKTAMRIAWVYPNPKPGFENIKGRFAFYGGNRPSTIEELS